MLMELKIGNNKASALIVSRNINVNTNFCEMPSKSLMSDECGTHHARRFFRILSRDEDIPVLRKKLNDAPAASVPAFANGLDGFGAKIAFPKIPISFHGAKIGKKAFVRWIRLN